MNETGETRLRYEEPSIINWGKHHPHYDDAHPRDAGTFFWNQPPEGIVRARCCGQIFIGKNEEILYGKLRDHLGFSYTGLPC